MSLISVLCRDFDVIKFGKPIAFQIPRSSEGKEWFYYTDKDVTLDLLESKLVIFFTMILHFNQEVETN